MLTEALDERFVRYTCFFVDINTIMCSFVTVATVLSALTWICLIFPAQVTSLLLRCEVVCTGGLGAGQRNFTNCKGSLQGESQ